MDCSFVAFLLSLFSAYEIFLACSCRSVHTLSRAFCQVASHRQTSQRRRETAENNNFAVDPWSSGYGVDNQRGLHWKTIPGARR